MLGVHLPLVLLSIKIKTITFRHGHLLKFTLLIPFLGLFGGTIWHLVGGIRNAPKGHRIEQAVSRVSVRVPILGGSFAIWGTLFSCFDCTFSHMRKKEDPWNAILSGAATG